MRLGEAEASHGRRVDRLNRCYAWHKFMRYLYMVS